MPRHKKYDQPANYIVDAHEFICEAISSEEEGRIRRAKRCCNQAILRLELATRQAQLRLARLTMRDSAARSLARR